MDRRENTVPLLLFGLCLAERAENAISCCCLRAAAQQWPLYRRLSRGRHLATGLMSQYVVWYKGTDASTEPSAQVFRVQTVEEI
jgi:hypothetical protein